MMNFISLLHPFSLEIGLAIIILGLFFLDLFSVQAKKNIGSWAWGLTFLLLLIHLSNWKHFVSALSSTYVHDALSFLLSVFFLITLLFILAMSKSYRHRFERGHSEFYMLILLASLGMITLASTTDFLLLFVSLELITVSFYVMNTYLRTDPKSIEAGLKYLVLGALSSGFLLYGISFIYGLSGSTHFSDIARYASSPEANAKVLLFGFLLVMVGVGFKMGSVPFHFWIPDVYEGAPTPATAFLSVGSKAAGFFILIRLTNIFFPHFQNAWVLLFTLLSAITLIYGNLGAIPQKNIKRFLGYSSIGHAGYLLMGFAAGSTQGLHAVLYYLFSYLFTNLCAFWVVILFSKATESDEIADYAGLSKRSPFLAATLFIALMSLAGVPPLAGFFGKFLLIRAVVEKNLIWLAVLGALNVVVSLYYYLMIVKKMYIDEPQNPETIPLDPSSKIGLSIAIAGIIGLGIFQAPLLQWIESAVKSIL